MGSSGGFTVSRTVAKPSPRKETETRHLELWDFAGPSEQLQNPRPPRDLEQ